MTTPPSAPPAAQPDQLPADARHVLAKNREALLLDAAPAPQDTADAVAEALEFAERRYIGKVGEYLTTLAAEVRRLRAKYND